MVVHYSYEIKNVKLKKMVENKAKDRNISPETIIWEYIGRGLMGDNFSEESFFHVHSSEYLDEINKALNVD